MLLPQLAHFARMKYIHELILFLIQTAHQATPTHDSVKNTGMGLMELFFNYYPHVLISFI